MTYKLPTSYRLLADAGWLKRGPVPGTEKLTADGRKAALALFNRIDPRLAQQLYDAYMREGRGEATRMLPSVVAAVAKFEDVPADMRTAVAMAVMLVMPDVAYAVERGHLNRRIGRDDG